MAENPYASPVSDSELQEPKKRWRFTVWDFLAVCVIIAILFALLMPEPRIASSGGRRSHCKNNLKQIALALHNYHDAYGTLPPAYTVDADAKPLHSWRTLILPYLDQSTLYESIDLSKPWNDPANAEAFKTLPTIYRCPSSSTLPAGHTSYLGSFGNDACFRPTEPRQFSEITDGTANTLMVIEVPQDRAVHWMSPQDADFMMVMSLRSSGKLAHTGGTQVALADGSVRFLSDNIDPQTLLALFTVAGGETVGEF